MRRLAAVELSSAQIEALRSLAGFGGADAVRSLGQLVGLPAEMGAARAVLFRREAEDELFAPERSGVAVRFRAEGGARMRVLVQFSREGASRIATALVGQQPSPALYRSVLAEAANILVSSYLSGVGAAVGMMLVPSVPDVAIGDLADAAQAAFGDLDEPLLLVADFRLAGLFGGRIFVAPEGDALAPLLATLGAV